MNLQLPFDRHLAECGSKHLALYRALREGIFEGRLPAGERLPSTRRMAALYGLSRGSVSLAYDMLAAEGYVRAGVGQGTFVSGGERDWTTRPEAHAAGAKMEPAGGSDADGARPASPELSAWGRRVTTEAERLSLVHRREAEQPDAVSFRASGIGDRWFPWMEWRARVAHQWKLMGKQMGQRTGESGDLADDAAGSLELREAIALRLRRERGIVCRPDDVVVTSGSMQAIALLAQLLLEEGRAAVVEDPSYTGTQAAVRATGAELIAAGVDGEGVVPEDWDAGLLFVTPTRQFPTGAVLKLERRLELLRWASRRQAWIVEDDYDSDFRWGGRPIEPLKSLDREERVVYVGSFSRSMRSEVRIGYAVLPPSLRTPFARAKTLHGPRPEGLAEQRALAEWMADGGYDRYMRRSRRNFHRLQDGLLRGLNGPLGGLFETVPSDAGLSVYACWRLDPALYAQLAEKCREFGVDWSDGRRYDVGGEASGRRPSALFGFAHLEEAEVEEGLARIRRAAETLGFIAPGGADLGGGVHA